MNKFHVGESIVVRDAPEWSTPRLSNHVYILQLSHLECNNHHPLSTIVEKTRPLGIALANLFVLGAYSGLGLLASCLESHHLGYAGVRLLPRPQRS